MVGKASPQMPDIDNVSARSCGPNGGHVPPQAGVSARVGPPLYGHHAARWVTGPAWRLLGPPFESGSHRAARWITGQALAAKGGLTG